MSIFQIILKKVPLLILQRFLEVFSCRFRKKFSSNFRIYEMANHSKASRMFLMRMTESVRKTREFLEICVEVFKRGSTGIELLKVHSHLFILSLYSPRQSTISRIAQNIVCSNKFIENLASQCNCHIIFWSTKWAVCNYEQRNIY